MRTITTTVYKIDEHPNKKKCFEWIRGNWHHLNDHSVDEVIESIKALGKEIGGTFNYCISAAPDRGEFIRFDGCDKDALNALNADDLPLTGVCWDASLIEGLRGGNPEKVLADLHNDTEYQYSDEGLLEMCEANEYEFKEDGSLI